MKRNTMQYLFDNMDTIPESLENIDESTVYTQTGICYDHIEKAVRTKLGFRKSKKTFRKKLIITLVAAALTGSAVSSTAIAENYSLVFGNFFGGYSYAATISNAEDVQVHVKDSNLNVKVAGLTGDERSVFIELNITKKDGSPFVDSQYHIAKRGTLGYERLNSKNTPAVNGDVKIVLNQDDEPDSFSGIGYDVWYSLENDNKTVKMCVLLEDVSEYPKGNSLEKSTWNNRTLQIQSTRFLAGKADKVLASFDNMDKDAVIRQSQLVRQDSSLLSYHLLNNTFTNTDVFYNGKTFDVYQGTFKAVNIPFDISLKLNYQVDSKKISIDDKTASAVFGIPQTDCQLWMSATRLSVYAKNDRSHQGEAVRFDREKTMVIMDDGSKYYLSARNIYDSSGITTMRLRYTLFPSEGSDAQGNVLNYNNNYVNDQMIDYNKVAEIIINGMTVYRK